MEDNFAFLLPVMMGTFSIVFFLLSRLKLKLPSAFAWGVAFSTGAAAFSAVLLPVPPEWQVLIADVFFFVSFYAYGEGLLVRFSRPRLSALRTSFVALCLLLDAYVIFELQSLETELLLVDIALTLLLALPVAMVLTRPKNNVDRALVIVAALVTLDTITRVIIFNVILPGSDAIADFNASQYAFFMQISGAALGLCFALAALCSVLIDILDRYRDAAERDPLTRLLNRRGFEDNLEHLREKVGHRGVVLTCDIDHFKRINDSWGHAAGDDVIANFARQLTSCLPPLALSARFGGEEFIAYVPNASLLEGAALAQAVCDAFAASGWTELGIDQRITASFGVAALVPADRSIHDTISRADKALYYAKAAGRNQVATETMLPSAPALSTQAA